MYVSSVKLFISAGSGKLLLENKKEMSSSAEHQ